MRIDIKKVDSAVLAAWAAKFWAKVLKTDGCWLWQGSRSRCGYGMFTLVGKDNVQAHRFAWALQNGRSPNTSELVLHSCDNPQCCRPDHLSLGTHKQNMREMSRRRRASRKTRARGESNSKLTREQVLEIKQRLLRGESRPDLAEMFGVCAGTIRLIDIGHNWE